MGNCLKSSASDDDISLLRDGDREPTESLLGAPPSYQESVPLFHPSPNVARPLHLLTEEEQIRIAKRIGLIQNLPSGQYDTNKKHRECIICMGDFMPGDTVRYLPCMHTYHKHCIDDWLMRSCTCPTCLEPVESALLTMFDA